MLSDLDTLLAVDYKPPAARWRALMGDCGERATRVAESTLVGLVELDRLAEVYLGASSLYFVEDDALRGLLGGGASKRANETDVRQALIVLNNCDLVFRFLCARKFNVATTDWRQTRVNTWGKWYVTEHALYSRYPEVALGLQDSVRPAIEEHGATYAALTNLLRQPVTSEHAEQIARLNALLPLRLLS